MATRYYPLNNKQEALVQSKEWWEKVLGRAKFPQDVTEYLFGALEHPITGKAYLVVDDYNYNMLKPTLTPQQIAFAEAHLLLESDPEIVDLMAALDAAKVPM